MHIIEDSNKLYVGEFDVFNNIANAPFPPVFS